MWATTSNSLVSGCAAEEKKAARRLIGRPSATAGSACLWSRPRMRAFAEPRATISPTRLRQLSGLIHAVFFLVICFCLQCEGIRGVGLIVKYM
jgi:hypothetical protein